MSTVITEAGVQPVEQDPTGLVGREQLNPPAAAAPAAVVAPAPAPKPEKKFTYQPTDENGRPMGGLQVIKYADDSELPGLLVKQNEQILRQLRKVTRDKELGVPAEQDDAEKFQNVPEFKPRDLTADERLRLSQQLLDPEKAAEARDLLVESAFGAKPEVVASTLNATNRFMVQQRAVDNYVEFVSMTPEYYDSTANRAALTGWMSKRNWAATVSNFNRAYQYLVGQVGLLELSPEVHQAQPQAPAAVVPPTPVVPVENPEPKPQVPAAPAPGLGSPQVEQPQAKRHSHVPSSLNSTVASVATDTPLDVNKLTVADLEKMPADQYRRNMANPAFRQAADAAYEEQAKRQRARQLQQATAQFQ